MKFEEVLPALREGKKIRRKCWGAKIYIYLAEKWDIIDNLHHRYIFNKSDLIDDDWEIIKKKKKVKLRDLTEEQYEKWLKDNCRCCCIGCPFRKVYCDRNFNIDDCWFRNKDLYSDKFLDQEVEIDE